MSLRDFEEKIDQDRLRTMYRNFLVRWEPKNEGYRDAFAADLMLLIQEVNRDAMKDVNLILKAALSRMPPSPQILTDNIKRNW